MMEFVFWRGAEVSYAAVGVGGWVCGWDWGRYWGCGTGSLTSTISHPSRGLLLPHVQREEEGVVSCCYLLVDQ